MFLLKYIKKKKKIKQAIICGKCIQDNNENKKVNEKGDGRGRRKRRREWRR